MLALQRQSARDEACGPDPNPHDGVGRRGGKDAGGGDVAT
jgi:hypothetical protein